MVANFVPFAEPLLLSCAEDDEVFPTEHRRKAIDLLRQEKKMYYLQVFQGVGHGFASKPDTTDPYQRECKVFLISNGSMILRAET
jgi:dienelactone hydrolase